MGDICRFAYSNLAAGADLRVSSARPGLVGMPAPQALGSAVAYALGSHTGEGDKVFTVQIDSVEAGPTLGLATFRWMAGGDDAWRESGVATGDGVCRLADGVDVKWVSGVGQDFYRGDAWTITAAGRAGASRLIDGRRDTFWRATGREAESISVDLGRALAVDCLVLADHNLSATATAVLKADPEADWDEPEFSLEISLAGPHLVAWPGHTCRHWRLELADPDCADSGLKASMLFMGPYFQPSRQFTSGWSRSTLADREITSSAGGRLSGRTISLCEQFALPLRGLSSADLAGLARMHAAIHDPYSGRLLPLWFMPFPSDAAQTFYCLPGPELGRVEPRPGRWDVDLSLAEVPASHA